MLFSQRTRRLPGPLLLFTAVYVAASSTIVRAHDPGLSSLDVNVSGGAISASLALAAPDVRLLIPAGLAEPAQLGDIARDAVRIFVDGQGISSVIDEVSIDPLGARVRLSFPMGSSQGLGRRVEIASDVPRRVARGHRELLVVSLNERVVAEKLLDAQTRPVAIDLGSAARSPARSASHFLELGVRHILSGYDHLLFLAGLLLAARSARELAVALTAFTAAHSVSLALVVAGGVHAPPSIVEPLIAASIAWVGLENLVRGGHGARWVIVFGFGLIHGFGFAGALLELGLGTSTRQIATALLSFNAGVEVGQLAVAGALLPLVWMMRSKQWHLKLVPLCSVAIIIAGTYWLFERLPY